MKRKEQRRGRSDKGSLDAASNLSQINKRPCPSVRRLVRWFDGPSIGNAFVKLVEMDFYIKMYLKLILQ